MNSKKNNLIAIVAVVAVLDLVARGMGNPSIARPLFLSDKTVRNHISTILSKIGALDRSEAIQMARQVGLGQPTTN